MMNSIRWATFALVGLATVGSAMADQDLTTTSWSDPNMLIAKVPKDKFIIKTGYTYATYNGRSLTATELFLGAVPSDNLYVWFSRQSFLAKGHSTGSRFDLSSSSYGFRYIINQPTSDDPQVWALQIQQVVPGDATAIDGAGGSAVYFGTRNNIFSILNSDNKGNNYGFSYASVKAAGEGSADVLALTYSKDTKVGKSTVLTQAQLVGQRWSSVATSNVAEVKAILSATYRQPFGTGFAFELQGDLMPFGIPMASGSMTGLSSFLIYEPGGATDKLRNGVVGFATARLTYSLKF